MKGSMDDVAILALFDARDEAALVEFEKKYKPMCLKLARDITGSDETAQECLNDLYLRLWDTIPPEVPRSLKNYACCIIRNLALQQLERARAQKRSAVIIELTESVADVPEQETGEITARINAFLETLSERDAMIFVRRYFYSEPVGEIAARLGLTENRVSKILHRMRRALRTYLLEGGITL